MVFHYTISFEDTFNLANIALTVAHPQTEVAQCLTYVIMGTSMTCQDIGHWQTDRCLTYYPFFSDSTTTVVRKKRGRPRKKRASDEVLENLSCIYCTFIGVSSEILDMHYHEMHSNRQLLDNFRGNNELAVKKEELENDCWDNGFDYDVSYDQDVSFLNINVTAKTIYVSVKMKVICNVDFTVFSASNMTK